MSWKRFLFLHLPVALAVTAAAAEGAAWALRDVAPRRHDLDRLVAALDTARANAPVVLLGDSVTQDVMKTYGVAAPEMLANLTTNQASGVIGAAFLLRRYLERNAPPTHVVIASTPEFYAYQPEGAAARTYVTSVFTRPEERAELRAAGIEDDAADLPAVVSLERRIGERLTGLVGGGATVLPMGDAVAAPFPEETGPVIADVVPQIAHRASQRPVLSRSAHAALTALCTQAARHGFVVHILRAPVPASVTAARGGDDALYAQLRQAVAGCPRVRFDDINIRRSFPDHAFRDADHLRRPGWTAVYARLLGQFVTPLSTGQGWDAEP